MNQYHIAVIVGSLRRDSLNRRFATALEKLAPAGFVLKQSEIDDLPLFNQDHEHSPTPAVQRFKAEIKAAHGVIFVTPEYNRSIPGVLKNAIDQGSRPYGEGVWAGKPAGVIGVSPGALGTALAQQHLRNTLSYLDMPTLNQPEAFIQASDALFDAEGNIGPASREFVVRWINAYAALVKKLSR
ncbi:MAG: NAD(P)H-dependent oxidoreductase [Chromatiales bacterium]|nr:NAD(P)H-dependent oxidoreductase [Chromatiales bacterium]